ncbi:glutamate cyclase domain-containing protein [Variovorax ureilyticus]|uniref:Glutamate cyclase domain-containing protein n=1 Tax=Variovorax ureilyticus TaxID=1836198 RepID=A0ABU8VNI5_9BURK
MDVTTSSTTASAATGVALTSEQVESGNRIDRLMTLEIRPLSGGLPPGIVVPMYEVCRAHQGAPLSMAAAAALKAKVRPGSTVVIATGAGVAPKLPLGETDGPVGAAALAAAIVKGLRAKVVFVTEDAHLPPVVAAIELVNAKLAAWAEGQPGRTYEPITVESFPIGMNAGQARSRELIETLNPSAVVFVERDGPNVEGQFHGVRGDCRDPLTVGYVYLLAYHAAEAGILTIGIGDGGNEVGFGAVREAIRDVLPMRGRSLAGHASGVVTVVPTDVTVSAAVSNWGACAVAAALAVLLSDSELLHDADTEHELIAVTVAAGARDGATSKQTMVVDGIDFSGHLAFVSLLRVVAGISIRTASAA